MDVINAYPIPGIREPVSCLTHLLAAPVFAVLGYFLIQRGRGSWVRMVSLATLVFSSVFLLSTSGMYHLLAPGTGRHVLLRLDVAGVFALIAGTATPVHTILFRGLARWMPLVVIWSAAVTGITLRTIFPESLPPGVGVGIFLLLGWGGLITCVVLWKRYGFSFVNPLVCGGAAYTLGALVLRTNWPELVPGVFCAHELWHVAVLLGLGMHWKFVSQFAAGAPDRRSIAKNGSVS